MPKIRLIFSNSKLPLSPLIRAVTWSKWSHVAIIIDDNRVIEATLSHGGVNVCSLAEFTQRAKSWCIVEHDCHNKQGIIEAALTQIGKKYDWTALLGVVLHRDWQADDSWFCSELVAWAFEKGRSPLFNKDALHRVTPQHLWMLASNIIQVA